MANRKDVLLRIKRRANYLNPALKKIANYILKSPDKVKSMSSQKSVKFLRRQSQGL